MVRSSGCQTPPLPLASKNSPGPIPRKHHWLLLSASEVHGYLEEKQHVVHVGSWPSGRLKKLAYAARKLVGNGSNDHGSSPP